MTKLLRSKITEKEFKKLAEETGVSQFDIQKLYAIGLFSERRVLDMLIRYDYTRIKNIDKYKPSQVVKRLSMAYHVSYGTVRKAINSVNVHSYYCKECGKLINRSQYVRNEGLCDDCVAKSIELP